MSMPSYSPAPVYVAGQTGSLGSWPARIAAVGRLADCSRFSVMVATAILLQSGADGLITLRLLAAGCVEVNPAMQALLAFGPSLFLIGKMAITVTGLSVLLAARQRPLFGSPMRAHHALVGLALVYALLLGYEAVLLASLCI